MSGSRAVVLLFSVLVLSWAGPVTAQPPDVAETGGAPRVPVLETRLEGILANVESLAGVDVRVRSARRMAGDPTGDEDLLEAER